MSKETATSQKPLFSESYKWYVLFFLTGVYTLNFVDRQILVILQESIKGELGLSDAQLGLLTGLAFAIFYVSLGIPIARLADKKNRRNIVAISLTIWSGMTALTGYVQNFLQLLLARIGVGIGEAGGSPPSHSMISDYFPKDKRATALAIYSVGIYIGYIVGYLLGGWIDEAFGWRTAFFVIGVPGVLYALLMFITVKEPPRGYSEPVKSIEEPPKMGEVIRFLFSRKTFLFLSIATGLHCFVGYGTGNFMPPFLARVHGMGSAEIGMWLSLSIGFGGGLGTWLGGYLADKMSKKNLKWFMWIPAISILLGFPFSLIAIFHSNPTIALIAYIIPNITFAVYMGPCLAVTHGMVSVRMRALASAILFFVLNLIGLGGGPFIVGVLSDMLGATYGTESIRYAIFIASFVDFLAVYCFYKAAQTVEEDLANAPA